MKSEQNISEDLELTSEVEYQYPKRLVILVLLLISLYITQELATVFAQPIAREIVIAVLDRDLEEEVKVNEEYRPLLDQIREAVEYYEAEGGVVIYKKSDQYISFFEAAPWIQKVAYRHFQAMFNGEISFFDSRYLEHNASITIMQEAPTELRSQVFQVVSTGNSYELFNVSGSGFAERQQHKKDIEELLDYIEMKLQENKGQPISAAKILYFWLKRNNGELSKALWDTALSLKFLARNNLVTGDYVGDTESEEALAVQYFQRTLIDEFSLVDPYSSLINSDNSNYSAINRIGLPYHMYSMVALLHSMPAEIVGGATSIEFLAYNNEHGITKVASDVINVMGLSAVEEYLLKFSE